MRPMNLAHFDGFAAAATPPLRVGAYPTRPDGYPIRIDGEGTWFYRDSPILRPSLLRLFASVLTRAEDGSYWLVTPGEQGRIDVEDVPFLAVEMAIEDAGPEQTVWFRTSLDDWVATGDDHPIRVQQNPGADVAKPYIDLRHGLQARIARAVYYELVDRCSTRACGEEVEVGIWSRGSFFALGRVPSN